MKDSGTSGHNHPDMEEPQASEHGLVTADKQEQPACSLGLADDTNKGSAAVVEQTADPFSDIHEHKVYGNKFAWNLNVRRMNSGCLRTYFSGPFTVCEASFVCCKQFFRRCLAPQV